MIRNLVFCLCALALLALTGCGSFRIDPTWERLSENQVQALAARQWNEAPGNWHIQQTVLLESRGHELLMSGFVRLDMAARTARVVAMNSLGVKFFDLEVSEQSQTEHFVAPDLRRFPEVATMLAESVRNIYLVPRLSADTPIWLAPYGPVAKASWQENPVFVFLDPATAEPVRKMSPERFWTVDYKDYAQAGDRLFPSTVVYTHTRAGLRLTLKTNKATLQ
ncbi:MAG: hypothetical protein R6W92_09710 [Desulfocurvibacter africanus]